MDFWHWYQTAQNQAQAHHIPSHELDWLVFSCTDLDKLALRLRHRLPTDWQHLPALWQLRLDQRQPVQYLAGQTIWRDLQLNVAPGVLIPRPETELIIDVAISRIAELAPQNPKVNYAAGDWADLGTGSGAIAIALARQLPQSQIHAVDCSDQALAIAQLNANHNSVPNVRFYQGHWFEPLSLFQQTGLGTEPRATNSRALVAMIANPPYIPTAEVMTLEPEVRDHEPHLALDGGTDGLRDIRHLIATAPEYLATGALWLVEHRSEQGAAIAMMLEQSGVYEQVMIHHDLSGWDRFVSAVYVGNLSRFL
ncbi:MAG: peptide chain release factor N(5)-glutamine methyltransferase [Pseudanabaena sp. ELA607]